MTISFTPNTNIKKIMVEGFGKVQIRPYGAGEELQISKNFRELDELTTKARQLLDEAKEKYGDDESKLPDSFKKDFNKIKETVDRLTIELNDLIKGTISSDEKGVAERIFNELPMSEIRRLVAVALGKETENAETERTSV